MTIISQTTQDEGRLTSTIQKFYTRFLVNKVAKSSNVTKTKGIPFQILFCYLISTIFSNKSAYRDYLMNKDSLNFSDKSFRNFLNDGRVNWTKFTSLLAKNIMEFLRPLTGEKRKEAFIIDDSLYVRENAKCVELAVVQYDHAKKVYKKGFRQLQLGWTDGNPFLPINSCLMSGKKKVCEAKKFDSRSHAAKRRIQAQKKSTEVMIDLLKTAQRIGIKAPYVLFDSWFSNPSIFHDLLNLNLHAVCPLKRTSKHHYRLNGNLMDVKAIFNQQKKRRGRSRYLLSVIVESVVDEKSVPVKLVFVRHRKKRNDYLVLATTDAELTEDEIIRLYGKRWSIELYFKMCKQHLRWSNYQGLSCDGMTAHTVTVAVAYMIFAVQHREEVDDRTIGELFYLMVSELADLTFAEAISYLVSLFQEAIAKEDVLEETLIHEILSKFINQLPKHYKNRFLSEPKS